MKSIFRKSLAVLMILSFVLLGLSFVNVNVKADATSYTLTFKSESDGDGSALASTTLLSDVFTSSYTSYVTGLDGISKAYYNSKAGLKLGASSNAGTLTITLTEAAQVKPTSVVVNAKLYNSTKAATLSVNGATAQSVTADFSDLTFTFSSKITSITLSSNKYIFISSITVNYVESADPSVSIVNYVDLLYIGENDFPFTCDYENIDDPSETTWNSSDSTVATIDSTGKLHALKIGKTSITATISNTTSDPIEVTILPNNLEKIDINTALAISELVGKVKTERKYDCFGYVKSIIDDKNFVLTDGSNDIVVYKYDHSKAENDKVLVSGSLINYNLETKEFSSPDLYNAYSVSFIENDGTVVEDIPYVKSGDKIVCPTTSKDGFTFQGWFKDVMLSQEFDFDNDTITKDTTLYAKFAKEVDQTIVNALNNTKSYMSLAYSFEGASTGNSYIIVKDVNGLVEGATYVLGCYVTKTSSYCYNGSFGSNVYMASVDSIDKAYELTLGGEEGAWTFTSSEGLIGCTAAKNMNAKGNGVTTWTISFDGDNALIESTNSTYGAIKYNSSSPRFLTYASGQTSIVLFRKVESFSFTESKFALRCGIDAGLSLAIASIQNAKYGIEVTCGDTIKKYESKAEIFVKDGDYEYVIIHLGDCLSNLDRISQKFTVRAYLEIDGDCYYSSSEKTYSVVDLLNVYRNITNDTDQEGLTTSDKVASLCNVLSRMGQIK